MVGQRGEREGEAFRLLTYAVIPIAMEIEAVATVTLVHEVVEVETVVFTGIAILTESWSATTTIRDIEPPVLSNDLENCQFQLELFALNYILLQVVYFTQNFTLLNFHFEDYINIIIACFSINPRMVDIINLVRFELFDITLNFANNESKLNDMNNCDKI